MLTNHIIFNISTLSDMEMSTNDKLSKDDVIYWLKRAEEWASMNQNHRRSTPALEISQNSEQLQAFLSAVLNRLIADGISPVLKNHPKLGHLLGRLCSCQHLLAEDEKVFSKLLSCVHALRAQHPQDGMEKKAKVWAESQFRYTASYFHQKNPASETAEAMGYTALEYNTLSSNKLIESIQRDLDHLIMQQQNYIYGLQDEVMCVEELSEMCLPLIGSTSSKELVDRVLLLHPRSAENQISQHFLERVTQTQACAYAPGQKNKICHSREALMSLWLQYLPALEQEILLLVQAFSQHVPDIATDDALKLIHSRDLPRACARHRILYEAVDSCVQQVLWQTDGCHRVIRFVHLFQVAVNEAIQELHSPEYSVHRLFLQRLCPLVNLLTVDPKDIPQDVHGIHLTSIDATLKTTIVDPVVSNNPQELYKVWMTLVKFLHWYHAAVNVLILDDHSDGGFTTVDACLDFLMWFHFPLSFGNCVAVKENLLRLIKSLHSCIMEDTFQEKDLEMLFSNLRGSNSKNDVPVALIINLVMSAILHATSLTRNNVLAVVDMMWSQGIASGSQECKLALLRSHLDIHQTFMVSGVGLKELCPTHVTEAIRILKDNT
ncbi:Fanconi anemia group C protein-like isoform X2 [Lytechinus variegatus]|uniref:Fanconi anemia group C protein-like isoform X2 n=1 Tax=Lytechinus variegatus TaxID=7654 RepID=UPI001BB1A0A7|nr:Fanconi anemia group C protein-like isoform X2 [Lytechinus variegatus]